ncbi:Asp23/Gls24 family envelope stress response protein [Pseudonocardia adelaidensis]|uniref:Asp23/Gls24 family envelope stress response protein n=1 Tax=Pseudonocardia adelaidensis TaxID=648754 RepID=A0ABP9ND63_9PSEU
MSDRPDPLGPVEVIDEIAEAARTCPAVAGLHGGRFGQHTTYLPGRRVAGVAVSSREILVGVVGCYPVSVTEIASQVRAAVGALVPGVPVTVNVEDLLLPGERLPGDTRDPAADDPAAPRPPASAQAESVRPLPVPAPVPGTGPLLPAAPPATRRGDAPVSACQPSATPPAPPWKERF